MYTKFNYSPAGSFYNQVINPCLEHGRAIYKKHEEEVHNCLAQYITEDGVINGTALKEHWFSISKKDVFISHSHDDINKVIAFAGWLHDAFGLEAFIDSCSWGYCDDLLNRIDKRYCYKPKTNTYDYDLRNYTTSHVHMMLSTALTEMIYNTECIIFFNTPQSINMASELDKIKKNSKQSTISPWIYHELSMTTMLQVVEPRRLRAVLEHRDHFDFAQSARDERPKIEYDVTKALSDMKTLTDGQLQQWYSEHNKKSNIPPEYALDELYRITFPNK